MNYIIYINILYYLITFVTKHSQFQKYSQARMGAMEIFALGDQFFIYYRGGGVQYFQFRTQKV